MRGHYFRQGEARMRVLRLFKVPASSFEDLRLSRHSREGAKDGLKR
ncbi:hypothetical protein LG3211_1820 [Lysobacter gummosus]|nr:hypothetical protein LG3211_1820 [Lysobacter gummosus]